MEPVQSGRVALQKSNEVTAMVGCILSTQRSTARLGAAAAALAIVMLSGSVPAGASDYRYWHETYGTPVGHGQPAASVALPIAPGVAIASPYSRLASGRYVQVPHYQGPDGSYDSLVDLSREVNGVPCGIGCQQRALARWGYRPAY